MRSRLRSRRPSWAAGPSLGWALSPRWTECYYLLGKITTVELLPTLWFSAGVTSPNAIAAVGLHKRYGDTHALQGVDLDVPAGTVCGLLGPNGAGKTTAVRVLTTLTHPDEGSRAGRGLRRRRGRRPRCAARIGLAVAGRDGRRPALRPPEPGDDRRAAPPRRARPRSARADELLEQFSLADAADRLARDYSGGMRRRLDLAATLVSRPAVLFLDEPTTGLDPRARNELWDVLDTLVGEGATILLTTQYLEEADRLAQEIVVVDHGRVIARGDARTLKRQVGGDQLEVVTARGRRRRPRGGDARARDGRGRVGRRRRAARHRPDRRRRGRAGRGRRRARRTRSWPSRTSASAGRRSTTSSSP